MGYRKPEWIHPKEGEKLKIRFLDEQPSKEELNRAIRIKCIYFFLGMWCMWVAVAAFVCIAVPDLTILMFLATVFITVIAWGSALITWMLVKK